jgi:hypothetical protein
MHAGATRYGIRMIKNRNAAGKPQKSRLRKTSANTAMTARIHGIKRNNRNYVEAADGFSHVPPPLCRYRHGCAGNRRGLPIPRTSLRRIRACHFTQETNVPRFAIPPDRRNGDKLNTMGWLEEACPALPAENARHCDQITQGAGPHAVRDPAGRICEIHPDRYQTRRTRPF